MTAFVDRTLVFVHILKVVNLGPADNVKNLRVVVPGWWNVQPFTMQDTAKLASAMPQKEPNNKKYECSQN
jgi:hypothetical protein